MFHLWRHLQVAFFNGMLRGYAGGVTPKTLTDLNDAKLITFTALHNIVLTDCWQTTPHSQKGFGTTTLSHQNKVVWMMQYCGEYDKKVIPFLKKALHQAYTEQVFHGGRGLPNYTDGTYTYVNVPTKNHFDEFEGTEQIYDANHRLLGSHRYWGMKLWM